MYIPYGIRSQRSAGSYSGTGTRPDLNNHANQLNPNNWRFWRSRGLPLALARIYARQLAAAARRWVRCGRWRVSSPGYASHRHLQGDPLQDRGEVWLCGGGGGAGAFTEAIVELKAGRQYALEVGRGGSVDGLPGGSGTRLMEVTPSGGRETLAEAHGGAGAGGVDQDRLVTLGGTGGPSSPQSEVQSSAPGGDGAPSRSDFADLPAESMLLAGADMSAVDAMPLQDLASSVGALRIPCAAGARADAPEQEMLPSATLTNKCPNTRSTYGKCGLRSDGHEVPNQQLPEDPVSDHMLVCLPQGELAYGANVFFVQDRVRLQSKCTCTWEDPPLKTEGTITTIDDPGTAGKQSVNVVFDDTAPFAFDEDCFHCLRRIKPLFNGSRCLGVACLRSHPGASCEALPSCLGGLAAWINRLDLVHVLPDSNGVQRDSLRLPLSSFGPKGGVSTEGTPSEDPAGHGGDGSCPEIVSLGQTSAQLKPQRTVTLAGFQVRPSPGYQQPGQYHQQATAQHWPNGEYTERLQDMFAVQGRSTFWSELSNYILFWCKQDAQWMLSPRNSFASNRAGQCLRVAQAPNAIDVHTENFWGWLELDASGSKWVPEASAGVASVGTRPSDAVEDDALLSDAEVRASPQNAGEPGLAVFYSCAQITA
ncbi:unnamed protein product [Polarella glacialis]|nr:unnamed protein product [Polarella glacialis]